MTIKANDPAFMIVVDLQQAREDIDKAIDAMEENMPTGASSRVRLAQQLLAKVAEDISLQIARGRIK